MKTYKQFNEGLKDYSNQGKNVRVPGEDTASFGKLFKDDLKQMGKFKNPKTGKLEGGLLPDPRKGYQVKQFVTGKGGIARTVNPFLVTVAVPLCLTGVPKSCLVLGHVPEWFDQGVEPCNV